MRDLKMEGKLTYKCPRRRISYSCRKLPAPNIGRNEARGDEETGRGGEHAAKSALLQSIIEPG
jgi:hypothetical protein